MHAVSTSEQMNSRIVTAVGELSGGAKSCRMDRMTRVMMLQHLVSRMRSAWVQKRMTGSKIGVEDSTKCRIESERGGAAPGSLASGSSGSGKLLVRKILTVWLHKGLTAPLGIKKTCDHDHRRVG